eukprot:144227-Prorocentrum_minimum.AAC.4
MSRIVARAFEVSRPWASRAIAAQSRWRPEDVASVPSVPSCSGSFGCGGLNPNTLGNVRGFAVGRAKVHEGPGLDHFIKDAAGIDDQVRGREVARSILPNDSSNFNPLWGGGICLEH